jgi:hypothetical protein
MRNYSHLRDDLHTDKVSNKDLFNKVQYYHSPRVNVNLIQLCLRQEQLQHLIISSFFDASIDPNVLMEQLVELTFDIRNHQ